MANSQGFWSYVHADDEAEGNRISRLARDVATQFEMLTGEPLDLFLDRDAIKWGEDWRDKIDSSLASIAFFIPVLTPRYFMRPECRRELQFFARRATRLGIKELVLPLFYVDVPSLQGETTTDDLIALVRTFQWEDWRDLRFVDPAAEGYRRGVGRLAERLVAANRQAENTDVAAMALKMDGPAGGSLEDSPGLLDRMATAEETLPKLKATMEAIGRDIEMIGQAMQEAAADVQQGDRQAQGFAARLLVTRRVARRLTEPAERVWSSGNDFASQLHEVDEGFRAIIERSVAEVQENPDSRTAVCTFFKAVRSLSGAAQVALDHAQGLIDAIAPLENISRDLRPVLRRLRQGLTTMVEAREISNEWVQLIDGSGVTCED
jgi:uncharacterized protein YukE